MRICADQFEKKQDHLVELIKFLKRDFTEQRLKTALYFF